MTAEELDKLSWLRLRRPLEGVLHEFDLGWCSHWEAKHSRWEYEVTGLPEPLIIWVEESGTVAWVHSRSLQPMKKARTARGVRTVIRNAIKELRKETTCVKP